TFYLNSYKLSINVDCTGRKISLFLPKVTKMPKSNSKGFTLIEVMVAITILALSLIVILNLFSRTISSTADIRNYTIGLILAQSKITEIKSKLETNLEGIFENGDVEYEWAVAINQSPWEGVEEIQLQVFWQGRKGQKSIELIGYRVVQPIEDKEEKSE
ncbi:MAG: prepilin-type N-terminal cleavage/methylation domain-containing protein, partial [bacterium]|nr:prepilin-type N-terminal cleavage/methylation domain-containing protein [bacterium]